MRKDKVYMHLPSAFGCNTAHEAISVLYSEGQWRRCLRCRDALPKLTCTVCHLAKEENAFDANHRKNVLTQGDDLRCIDCETCKKCGVKQKDHRSFSRDLNYRHLCSKCEPRTCSICRKPYRKNPSHVRSILETCRTNQIA